jgi:hypothetical protein
MSKQLNFDFMNEEEDKKPRERNWIDYMGRLVPIHSNIDNVGSANTSQIRFWYEVEAKKQEEAKPVEPLYCCHTWVIYRGFRVEERECSDCGKKENI